MDVFFEIIRNIFSYSIFVSADGKTNITIGLVLIIIAIYIVVGRLLKMIKRFFRKQFDVEDRLKFNMIFKFIQYFVYTILIALTLDSFGIKVTAVLLGSTALLVGVGLGLQQFFQDLIAGVLILLDKSVHVGDVIELNELIVKIYDISLRTTKAITVENKVLIIPNHKFLNELIYNWTQNDKFIRESIKVGVAYESDVEQVTDILIDIMAKHTKILKTPKPEVVFLDFGESSLDFELLFTINNSFARKFIKSDIRYMIYNEFKNHNINIPFPQRDIHIHKIS